MKLQIKTIGGSILFESEAESLRELLLGAVSSRANLSGADLSRANLSGANLSRANLSRADLFGAELSGANLSRADLYGANLSGADLSRANLSRANLSGADLSRADLYGADLFGADLSRADLSRANLSGANLYGADLFGAEGLLPNGVHPLQISGTFHHLIVREAGHITIGCEHHPVEWWEEHYKAIGRRENYTKAQLNEYRNFIALAKYWMKLHKCEAGK